MTTIAIFDLDGTIDQSDTFAPFLLGLLLRSPARWPRLPLLVWAFAMHYLLSLRDNEWLKSVFLVHIVGRQPVDFIASYSNAFVERRLENSLNTRVLKEIKAHRLTVDRLVLATASPDIYARLFGERLGFTDILCTDVQKDTRGQWTGKLTRGNCYGLKKYERIAQFLKENDAPWSDVIFYSDHHSDLPIFQAAGVSFAVNPSRKLSEKLIELGIPVLE